MITVLKRLTRLLWFTLAFAAMPRANAQTSWPPLASVTPPPPEDSTPAARWARLARQVPGRFAGMYLDPSSDATPPAARQLVILLVEPERGPEARVALRAYLDSTYRFPEAPFPYSLETAEVRRARWDYAELYAANQYLTRHLPSGDLGVVSWDVDERANRLAYGVPSEAARRAVAARLAKLEVPDGLVALSLERQACTSEMVSAVRVWVRDADTKALIPVGTWLIARSRAYADSVQGQQEFSGSPLAIGTGRTGVFDLTVRREGYHDWVRTGVRVESTGCHPKTVELTALLERR